MNEEDLKKFTIFVIRECFDLSADSDGGAVNVKHLADELLWKFQRK